MTAAVYNLHGRVPVCIDADAESVPGSDPDDLIKAELFFIETTCAGIRCPPNGYLFRMPF